jgi:hypothetical protein
MTNLTEIIVNADITSFGNIQSMYKDIKLSLNTGDKEVDISPILVDENNEEAIYITLDKNECKVLAAILNAYSDLL